MSRKIAFLFGAGAEGKGNYGLPTGIEFLKSTFFLGKEEKYFYLEPLENQFKNKSGVSPFFIIYSYK